MSCILPCCYATSLASQSPMSQVKVILEGGEVSYRSHRTQVLENLSSAQTLHASQNLMFYSTLSLWYDESSHENDFRYAKLILMQARMGIPDAKEVVEHATGRELSALTESESVVLTEIRDRVRPITPPTHEPQQTVQDAVEPMEAEMKLDSKSTAIIETVINPENMRKIANRQASNSASIHVLTGYVAELCDSEVNPKTVGKLKTKIRRLLQDEEPNREWILMLVSALNSKEKTRPLYNELKALIQQ